MSIAGYVSPRMPVHYSHVRLKAKRDALAVLSDGPQTDGRVAIDVTKASPDAANEVQDVDNLVNVTGIEPVPPCLQSRLGKSLNALSGVAYTENQQNSRSSIVPKLSRSRKDQTKQKPRSCWAQAIRDALTVPA